MASFPFLPFKDNNVVTCVMECFNQSYNAWYKLSFAYTRFFEKNIKVGKRIFIEGEEERDDECKTQKINETINSENVSYRYI